MKCAPSTVFPGDYPPNKLLFPVPPSPPLIACIICRSGTSRLASDIGAVITCGLGGPCMGLGNWQIPLPPTRQTKTYPRHRRQKPDRCDWLHAGREPTQPPRPVHLWAPTARQVHCDSPGTVWLHPASGRRAGGNGCNVLSSSTEAQPSGDVA